MSGDLAFTEWVDRAKERDILSVAIARGRAREARWARIHWPLPRVCGGRSLLCQSINGGMELPRPRRRSRRHKPSQAHGRPLVPRRPSRISRASLRRGAKLKPLSDEQKAERGRLRKRREAEQLV
jgi:hypothetical protein